MSLPDDVLAIVHEEEALLERVRVRLARERTPSGDGRDRAGLFDQLRDLREEASGASAADLPSLFQQMGNVRALAGRAEGVPPPDEGTPYFAHLRLRGPHGPRDYLLGRSTFIDLAADVRIVDWRFAPVARVFYRYQVGDDYEEQLPGGLAEGVVEVRRVVVIEQGRLTRIVEGPRAVVRGADGVWRLDEAQRLEGGAGTAARPGALGVGAGTAGRAGRADVSALLDAEQFEALGADADRALLVLGTAGSGKTTVALHRLAKLTFDEPNRFHPWRLHVVVPEEGLARLSRRLLEPLGLQRVRVDTLDEWLHDATRAAFGVREIRTSDDTPALAAQLKRHPALRGPLLARLGAPTRAWLDLAKLRRRLLDAFADRAFVTAVVEASDGALPLTTIDETVRHTRRQLDTSHADSLRGVDADRTRTIDGGSIADGTPDDLAGTVDAEDLALLLYLRARAADLPMDPWAHLVLDEAEDFSVFELEVLGRLLDSHGSCTLAGDELQQTQSSFPGWDEAVRAMGLEDPATCRLQVSYRCPKPIAAFAQAVLGRSGSEPRAGRDGAPVGVFTFPGEAQAQLFLSTALRELCDREPEASIGVVASSPESAQGVFRALEGLPEARLVTNGQFAFDPGVDVTDVDGVKGLEFDYVVVPDASTAHWPDTPEGRRRLHVAVTRASHQLWLVAPGALATAAKTAAP